MSTSVQDILFNNTSVDDIKLPARYKPTFSMFQGLPTEETTSGNEAIDFNVSSKLGTELVTALDAAMKHRDSLLQEKLDLHPDITRIDLVRKVRTEMAVYTRDVLIPQMKKTIHQHAGIRITKIKEASVDFNTTMPSLLFAIDISFNESLSTIESVIDTIVGTDVPSKKPAKYADVYNEIADTWSPKDTKLSTPRKNVIQAVFKKLDIATTMYFDQVTAFFSHFYVSKQESIAPFTAREIAAIVIHEVGHVHTLVERMADDFYRKKYTEVAISDLINSRQTIDEKFDLIDEIVAHNERTKLDKSKSKKVDISHETKVLSKINVAMKKLSEKRESIMAQIGTGTDTAGGFGGALADFIMFLLNLVLYAHMNVVTFVIRVLNELMLFLNINTMSKDRESRKHSDTVYTTRNMFALETWADEFAVRLGFGGELNTAFAKMQVVIRIYSQRIFYTDHYLSGFKDTWFYFLYSKMIYASTTITSRSDNYSYLGHENTPDRVKTIERMIIDFFKTNRNKFDPVMMDHMIADFEKAVQGSKQVNKPGLFYMIVDVLGVLVYHLTTPTVVLSKLFKVLSKTSYYDDLHVAIQNIENNKVFYHKAKLDQIARKLA